MSVDTIQHIEKEEFYIISTIYGRNDLKFLLFYVWDGVYRHVCGDKVMVEMI
jgi:hypothetical protein